MKEIAEDEAKSFEDKCTFLSLFHFLSDYLDVDSRGFDFRIKLYFFQERLSL